MKKSDGYIWTTGEDEHCSVKCVCGEENIQVAPAWITRCPNCNRGFRSEIVLWLYNPDEVDPEILDRDEWRQRHA